MWKPLKHGEKVSVGDTLRYPSNSNSLLPADHSFAVVRVDQHYFEIIQMTGQCDAPDAPARKAVRYTDIDYNIKLERWSEPKNLQSE